MASAVRQYGGTVNMLENRKNRETFKEKQGVTSLNICWAGRK